MSGEHAKNEKVSSGGKPESSDKVPSGEIKSYDDKHKERKDECVGSTISHKEKDAKKKKTKKGFIYKTDSSPSTSSTELTSSKHQRAQKE
jgi:translation elongation factor EF-1alpha